MKVWVKRAKCPFNMTDPCSICGERVKVIQWNAQLAKPESIKDVWELWCPDKSEEL